MVNRAIKYFLCMYLCICRYVKKNKSRNHINGAFSGTMLDHQHWFYNIYHTPYTMYYIVHTIYYVLSRELKKIFFD